jgi:hypothetical protein
MKQAHYFAFSVYQGSRLFFSSFFSVGIFYPPGEPISPQMRRRDPFAVGLPQLHEPLLASTATSARE